MASRDRAMVSMCAIPGRRRQGALKTNIAVGGLFLWSGLVWSGLVWSGLVVHVGGALALLRARRFKATAADPSDRSRAADAANIGAVLCAFLQCCPACSWHCKNHRVSQFSKTKPLQNTPCQGANKHKAANPEEKKQKKRQHNTKKTEDLDFDRASPCFLGRLSGNVMCTQYLLHGQRATGPLREELAALRFRKPSDAPRSLRRGTGHWALGLAALGQ